METFFKTKYMDKKEIRSDDSLWEKNVLQRRIQKIIL